MKKKCNLCSEEKDIEEYHKDTRRSKVTGLLYRRGVCKKCYNSRKTKKRLEVRAKFRKYKEGLSCEYCGYSKKTHSSFSINALEFHHILSSTKKYTIGNMISQATYTWKTIMNEVNKCRVLCCLCHRERHGNKDES